MTAAYPRVGDWMQTYTGQAFWPLDPNPFEIHPADIAHALSMICRYGGHSRFFYSVAEHCVLVSRAVAPEYALWGLLHDASEAYVGDMVRPLKRHMPQYRAVEDNLLDHIACRFGLEPGIPQAVHDADNRILLDERQAVMAMPPPLHWGPVEDLEPLGVAVQLLSPQRAESAYLERLYELMGGTR